MSSTDVRKGITNAKFNEDQSNILFFEIGILSILIGVAAQSWWAFGIAFVGLILSLRVKFLAIPLIVIFSIAWGGVGYGVGCLFDSSAASVVLAVIAFLCGLGSHLGALEWANDIGGN